MDSPPMDNLHQVGKYVLSGYPIGRGTYGNVHNCRLETEPPSSLQGVPRLVGKFVMQGDPGGNYTERRRFEDVQREALFLASLEHANIVKLVDIVVTTSLVLFVMPYCVHGDLHQALCRVGRSLVEDEAVYTYRQLAAAVQYLHFKKVLHRDLKSKNILVTSSSVVGEILRLVVVVSDFGQSKMCGDRCSAASVIPRRVGTLPYMALEMYERRECGFAVDLWSLGIVFYEIKTRHFPGDYFEEDRDKMVPCPCQSSQAKLNDDINTHLPDLLRDVVAGLLKKSESGERMTAREVSNLLAERYPAPSASSAGSSSSSSSDSSIVNMECERTVTGSGLGMQDEEQSSELEKCRQKIADLERRLEVTDRQRVASDLALAQELEMKERKELERVAADQAFAQQLDNQEHRRAAKRQRRHPPSVAPCDGIILRVHQLGGFLMM